MAIIAAEPYPFDLDPAHAGLVIIDMQRDFLEPGGFGAALGNDVSLLRRTIAPTRRLLEAARAAGLTVIHTREGHRPDLADLPPAKKARGRLAAGIGDPGPMGRILVRGEPGHDIIPELYPLAGEPVVDKPGKGAFHATDLDAMLKNRGIAQLIVCGVTTEVCVNTTVREANDRGYECVVVEDCVGSYFPEFQEMGLRMIKAQGGIFGWVASSDAVIAALPATGGSRRDAMKTAADRAALVGSRRLERLFRPVHQCRAERDRADRVVPARRQPAGRHRLRPDPAGARHRLAARQSLLRLSRLAARQKRGAQHVTAMPYGPSVPHMFIVVFLIMLPIYLKTHDPLLAWRSGLVWCLVIGAIVLLGAFVGPTVRKYTPRAAMLGTLAGISIAFISMRPAFLGWEDPWLFMLSLTIVLVSWMAGVRLPFGLPGGLVAVVLGTVLAWLAKLVHLDELMQPADVVAAIGQFGLRLPYPSTDFAKAIGNIGPLLVTAVPLGIYNFTEGMNNVESAAAAGDDYSLRQILLADGAGAIVGALLGSPFPPAVYIGHPGWKAVGGRIGYSLATGVVIGVVCFLGLTALLLAVIPLVAILPILLYIGLVIGAQAFQATPPRHAPAIILAILPNIAAWSQTLIDGALGAAGTSADKLGMAKLGAVGVVYHGMALLGGGAVLAGLILGAIAAFIIDRKFEWAALFAAVGAVLSFFGFIHGTSLGIGNSTPVAVGYLIVAGVCLVLSRQGYPEVVMSDEHAVAED